MNDLTEKIALNFDGCEIIQPSEVSRWGKTLVVAPHPDDESLGSGGAIRLLRELAIEVVVLTMSDGTLSHPNSAKFPPEKLRVLREREMIAALDILGVGGEKITFWRLPDRRVPNEGDADFLSTVDKSIEFLHAHQPQTILVPWRRDPHPDHRATWRIFSRAVRFFDSRFRLLEYPIWLWEMAQNGDLPNIENIITHCLNIESVAKIKQRAIRAHLSQTTDLIDDDPHGFRLSEEVLAHFAAPFEVYFEEMK